MSIANRVVFLGFAFHPMNMQIITPEHVDDAKLVKIFATTYGISDSDEGVIKGQIKESLPNTSSVNMKKISCFEFFGEYWRSLSFC
ncbi:MAG: hypothetical protein QG657_518 [Acidobacteriota bacterium]|nr:hypothetical protein [Acidobacteriota bacterium]